MKRLLILLLILTIFLSGCAQQSPSGKVSEVGEVTTTVATTTTKYEPVPENIEIFSGVKEGDLIRFFFGFNDRVGHSGKVVFKIVDDANKTVYSSSFDVDSDDYVDYEFKLTGQGIGKVYEWKIPFNNIQKGIGTGNAYLTFTTINGKTLSSETSFIEIPTYTEDEIKTMYENQYLQSAKNVGQTTTEGNFEVTLVRIGYFTHLQYDTWGSEVTEFRADIKVKNIGGEKDTFSTYNAVMIVGNKQYEYSYNSKFEGFEIYPDVVKEGYIIFKDVPKGLTGDAKIVAGTSWYGFNEVTYEFLVKL